MPYTITSHTDFIEVNLTGHASKWDVIQAVGELMVLDPRKEKPDLWTVADGCVIPLAEYPAIVEQLAPLYQKEIACPKSAIVASSAVQRGLAELYKSEATVYPFDMRIFDSRAAALDWFRDAPAPTV